MPKRSRLKRGSSKARSTRMTKMSVEDSKVKQIVDFQSGMFQTWDVQRLQQKALEKKFREENGFGVSNHYSKTHENRNVSDEYARIKKEVVRDFGSLEEYGRVRDYANTRIWNSVDSLNKNKIKGRHMSGVFVTVPADMFYNFAWLVLKGERLEDLRRVHEMFTEPQKEQFYSPDGIIETDIFTMKRYKNGSLDMTFKSDADAKKVYDEWKRLGGIYWKKRDEVGL